MKHEVVVLQQTIGSGGAVGAWLQGAGSLFNTYQGGYIIGVGFCWDIPGALNAIPAECMIGYGANGSGAATVLQRFVIPSFYTPGGVVVMPTAGIGPYKDLRAPIPGGVLIPAANYAAFVQNVNANAFAAIPNLHLEFTVWIP